MGASNSFLVAMRTNVVFLPDAAYVPDPPGFTTNLNVAWDTSQTFPQLQWGMAITNNLRVLVVDVTDPTDKWVVDYVHLRGLVGVLLVYLALTLANVVIIPHFHAPDEPRNVAYAFEVAHGHLPRIDDPLPHERMGTKPLPRTDFHASAHHPPLYYAAVGPLVRAGVERHDLRSGVLRARLVTMLFGAAAIVGVCPTGKRRHGNTGRPRQSVNRPPASSTSRPAASTLV